MPTERDDESGQFKETYSTTKFKDSVQDLDVATTSNVADEVGCSYDLAYRRLCTLADEGVIEKTSIGGSFVWEVSD